MGKILCYLYDEMADFEMTLAIHLLGSAVGKEIVPIASEMKMVTSKSGLGYMPRMTVADALELEDVEGLVIPGGYVRDLKLAFHEMINKLDKQGKLIAAICAAPEFLAKAGILEKHKYTTTLTVEALQAENVTDYFPRHNYVGDMEVVRDGNLITATGRCFVDFAMEICDYLKFFKNEEERKEYSDFYKGL